MPCNWLAVDDHGGIAAGDRVVAVFGTTHFVAHAGDAGPMATTFVVGKPPYLVGDQWRMVVDGQELIKTSDSI